MRIESNANFSVTLSKQGTHYHLLYCQHLNKSSSSAVRPALPNLWLLLVILSFVSLFRHILKSGLDGGRWTVDGGRWTMDDVRWTVDYGPFHGHAINHFVTSRIKHTPLYETFLPVLFTIASRNQSLPGFLVTKSRFRLATGQDMYHLGLARQRKTISSGLF